MSNLLKKEKNLLVLKPKTIIITDRQEAAQNEHQQQRRRNERIGNENEDDNYEGAKSLAKDNHHPSSAASDDGNTVGNKAVSNPDGASEAVMNDNNADSAQVILGFPEVLLLLLCSIIIAPLFSISFEVFRFDACGFCQAGRNLVRLVYMMRAII